MSFADAYRGSGIIAYGVTAFKPVVYTRGIRMSEFLSFGNAEAASDPEEFAQKILKETSA